MGRQAKYDAMISIGFAGIGILLAFAVVTLGLVAVGRISVDRLASLWGWMAVPVLAASAYLGLMWAPGDIDMGDVQRIT